MPAARSLAMRQAQARTSQPHQQAARRGNLLPAHGHPLQRIAQELKHSG